MNEVPTMLFICMVVVLFLCMVISVLKFSLFSIIAGVIAVILSYTLSKISINGVLVQQFGDVTTSDTVITDTVSITNLPMSYLFLFIGVITLLITINNILVEVKYNLEPNLEGDFDL